MERYPVSCEAQLLHFTTNRCVAYELRLLTFTLEELGLNAPYFNRGTITIKADNASAVRIQLP